MKNIVKLFLVLALLPSFINSITIQHDNDLITRIVEPFPDGAYIQNVNPGNRQDMTDAKGYWELDQATGTQFSVHSDDPLNMVLKNGSTLELRGDVGATFKDGDFLNIVGKNNEIYVENALTLDKDVLRFAENAELKIIFSDINSTVTFFNETVLDLENGSTITFEGSGTVQFGSSSVINFKNSTTDPVKPLFILKDSAVLTLPGYGGTLRFQGKGNINLENSARIDVTPIHESAGIIVGNYSTDIIDISVIGTSQLKMRGDKQLGVVASFSFNEGQTSLMVDQGGIITVDENGVLEINSLDGAISSANFTQIYLGANTTFNLHPDGMLSLAPNKNELPVLGGNNIIWNNIATTMGLEVGGDIGLIRYLAKASRPGYSSLDFTGRLFLDNAYFNTGFDGNTALNISKILVNQNSNLTEAIEFIDSDGTKYIRLKNGALAPVAEGDVIVGENVTTGVVFAHNNLDNVSYKYQPINTSPYWERVVDSSKQSC